MLLMVPGAASTVERFLPSPRLGHFLTPRSYGAAAKAAGRPWAADNGAFVGFDEKKFRAMLRRLTGLPGCRFVLAPDAVADAGGTLALFDRWEPIIRAAGLPVGFAGQDGQEWLPVPWDRLDALFVGGSTAWKLGEAAGRLIAEASARGKWVHMGRCSTRRRLEHAYRVGCDSVDGTALGKWPQILRCNIRWLREIEQQGSLFD